MNSEKKAAWDAVHAAYSYKGTPIVTGVAKRKYAPPAPLRPMPFRGGAQKEEIPGREEEGPKEIKAKKDMSELEALVKKALKADSSKVFQKDSGGEDSERSYSFVFDKPKGYSAKEVEEVLFKLIPEHHDTLSEMEGQWEYEFQAEVKDVNKYLKAYMRPSDSKAKAEKGPAKSDNQAILADLEKVVAEATEASKEGGKFKKRENWKGKAAYMKKIDALWNKYSGGADAFYGKIPFESGISWKPKDKGGESHASRMQRLHGTNID